jgi:outer membrane protein assembly factor BamB
MFGGMLSLSSNGSTGGVIWATVPLKGCWQGRLNEGDAHEEFVEGIAYAYDANEFRQDGGLNTLKLLWSNKNSPNTEEPKSCESAETIDESRFTYNKFCPPVVADGKLFITTGDGRLLVFQPK